MPEWTAYDERAGQCFELGRTIRVRPVLDAAQLQALEHVMKQIFAETANVHPRSIPNHSPLRKIVGQERAPAAAKRPAPAGR